MKQYILSDYTNISIKLSELNHHKLPTEQCKNDIQELVGLPIKSSTGEIVGEITEVSNDYIFGRVKTESLEFEMENPLISISDIPQLVKHCNSLFKY